jgi:hypothetical protein
MLLRSAATVRKLSELAKVAVNSAVVLPLLAKVTLFLCVLPMISPSSVTAAAPGAVPVPRATY